MKSAEPHGVAEAYHCRKVPYSACEQGHASVSLCQWSNLQSIASSKALWRSYGTHPGNPIHWMTGPIYDFDEDVL